MPSSRLNLGNAGPSKPPPRGRPNVQRANKIRQLVIEVAAEIMLEHGFDGASLDAIASAAGVTKRTIYDRFGSKEDLLREVLISTSMPARCTLVMPAPGASLRERLIEISTGLSARWLDPRMQRWMRLAGTEFAQRPKKVPMLQSVLDDLHTFVAEVLRAQLGEQGASLDMTTVKVYTSMIAAPAQSHALLGLDLGSPEQQKIYTERVVDMLMTSMGWE